MLPVTNLPMAANNQFRDQFPADRYIMLIPQRSNFFSTMETIRGNQPHPQTQSKKKIQFQTKQQLTSVKHDIIITSIRCFSCQTKAKKNVSSIARWLNSRGSNMQISRQALDSTAF